MVRVSITARMNPAVTAAIGRIEADDWTPIRYPNAVWDDDEQRLISDAEIAEIDYTAFTSRRKDEHIEGRLIVRRVKRLNPNKQAGDASQQQELFSLYRYHAVFTDSPLILVQAEKAHRGHAIIEQVHADLKHGPLAHLPSGSFQANSAWLVLAAIAFNLTRASGCLGSAFHARATTGTIRAQLINVPARLARSARKLAAPAQGLALGTGLDPTVRRDPWTTAHSLNPTTAARPNPRPEVEEPDRPAAQPRPDPEPRSSSPVRTPQESGR